MVCTKKINSTLILSIGVSQNSYSPGRQGNGRVPGIQGNVPADIHILGDPNVDQVLGVKVATPDNIYNVELQRVNHNLFHEDVRYLSVSVDSTGKTIFKEEYKPVSFRITLICKLFKKLT